MSNPWPEPPNYYDTPPKGSKVMLQTPGFPVIYQEPSVSQVGACSHANPYHAFCSLGVACCNRFVPFG